MAALAVPRFFFVYQLPMTFQTEAGKTPSPTPKRKRTASMLTKPPTTPVSAVTWTTRPGRRG